MIDLTYVCCFCNFESKRLFENMVINFALMYFTLKHELVFTSIFGVLTFTS